MLVENRWKTADCKLNGSKHYPVLVLS